MPLVIKGDNDEVLKQFSDSWKRKLSQADATLSLPDFPESRLLDATKTKVFKGAVAVYSVLVAAAAATLGFLEIDNAIGLGGAAEVSTLSLGAATLFLAPHVAVETLEVKHRRETKKHFEKLCQATSGLDSQTKERVLQDLAQEFAGDQHHGLFSPEMTSIVERMDTIILKDPLIDEISRRVGSIRAAAVAANADGAVIVDIGARTQQQQQASEEPVIMESNLDVGDRQEQASSSTAAGQRSPSPSPSNQSRSQEPQRVVGDGVPFSKSGGTAELF